MVSFTFGISLLLISLDAFAAHVKGIYSLHESSDIESRGWMKSEQLPPTTYVKIHIVLTQSNLERGHDLLMKVADPDSPYYGQHWSQEAVDNLFAPALKSIEAVRNWLVDAGIPQNHLVLSADKQWIRFKIPVVQLETLLETKYDIYEHRETKQRTFACEGYSLPKHIRQHVDYVTPGIPYVSRPKRTSYAKRYVSSVQAPTGSKNKPILTDGQCHKYFTPQCYRDLYRIPKANKAQKGNEMGIYETYYDAYAQVDLDGFFRYFSPYIPQGTSPIVHSVDGGKTNISNVNFLTGESELDLDIAYPIIYPQNITVFQLGNRHHEFPHHKIFNRFLEAIDGQDCNNTRLGETGDTPEYDNVDSDQLSDARNNSLQCGVYKPTNVISISYGVNEIDLPIKYQQRECNEWMKLGLQGVSVFLASGDNGVAASSYSPGLHGACLGNNGTIFVPSSPVTCPYVTAVGSTKVGRDQNIPAGTGREVATTAFGSGGGFSNIYDTPDYQYSAVHKYLTKHPPEFKSYSSHLNDSFGKGGGVYNRNGRGFPDVSAIGWKVVAYSRDAPYVIGGTSAAAPLWGALINRINEERLAIGKSTVGFINPVLYKNAHVLNDIVEGSNPGCKTKGFSAAKGWDAVTGLGTPDYPKLLEVFLKLP